MELRGTTSAPQARARATLLQQITVDHSIDPADGVEPVKKLRFDKLFKADVIVGCKKMVLEEARKNQPGLVL